jgi:radical SAM protein with 4Fe4S-binding SPASM domain
LDLQKIEEYYKTYADKYGWEISWSHELYKVCTPESYEFALRGQDFQKLREGLDYGIKEMAKGNPFFKSFSGIIEALSQSLKGNVSNSYKCGMNNVLILNNKGQKFLCQVHAELFGKVKILFGPGKLPDDCKNCIAADICRGGCPLLPEEYKRLNCSYTIAYYDQIIKSAMEVEGVEIDK